MNDDIKQLNFIDSNQREKVLAIRELCDGTVVDVRQIEYISSIVMEGTGFILNFKSGGYHRVIADNKYRNELVNYWRYHCGV